MEKERLNRPDRILLALLTLSVVVNMVLAVVLENGSAERASIEQKLNKPDSISTAEMASLVSGNPPTLGEADAPVTLVLFADFQCPYCRQFSAALRQLSPEQKRETRVVFRQFPLPMHKFAYKEAELTACAARQSNEAFWALYEYLYTKTSSQEDPTEGAMQSLKNGQGVDMKKLSSCLSTHQSTSIVEHDIALGQTYGVHSTPTMFINGKRLSGSQRNLGSLLRSIADQP